MCLGAERQDDIPNTFAPEGASRCRALASGLRDRAAGRKERPFRGLRALNSRRPEKSRKVGANGTFVNFDERLCPCRNTLFEANRAMNITRRRVLGMLAAAAAFIGVPSV
jgi:hypothetical protein